MTDGTPYTWNPLPLPPLVMANLRTRGVLCIGLIRFDRKWGPLAWIADVRPNSKASELLKEPTRRSEIYEGLAYTGLEFTGLQDEQIVVARHERKETPDTGPAIQIYTDLLLFSVDEKQLADTEGASLYSLLTLAKVVMDRSEGMVEKIPDTLFSALVPKSTDIEDVVEGFRVIRAPKISPQSPLFGLIFVDLKQKKFMPRFWPGMIEQNDTTQMELFLFRMLTRQPEPPWGFSPPHTISFSWGFHTRTIWNGYSLTTLYSRSFGMSLAALSRDPLSETMLTWFNILLTLLESLGLELDGDAFQDTLSYLISAQNPTPKFNKESQTLEMMLRSKELIPLFQSEHLRTEIQHYPHRLISEKYPKYTTLITEMGSDTIYSLAKSLEVPLYELVRMIRFLQSRDIVNIQKIKA